MKFKYLHCIYFDIEPVAEMLEKQTIFELMQFVSTLRTCHTIYPDDGDLPFKN